MPGEDAPRFGDMPSSNITAAAEAVIKAPRQKWTFPAKFLGMRWKAAGLEDSDRTFWLSELTPEMQHAAAKVAKDNSSLLQQELLFRSLVQIGDRKVGNNHDFKVIWYKAIGPKCRMLLSQAFGEMVSVDEADSEAFLASGTEEE